MKLLDRDNIRFIILYVWLAVITAYQSTILFDLRNFESRTTPVIYVPLQIPKQSSETEVNYTSLINKIHVKYGTSKQIAAQIIQTVYKYTDDYTFPSVKTVLGLIATESSFNPQAVSYLGAKGLMQIMERWHGPVYGIEDNIKKGINILKEYRQRTQTDVQAIEAYNIGITALLKGTNSNKKFVKTVLRHRENFKWV